MNITFFIGNGFDINLGLETKYADFYPYFLENASENNMIIEWITNDEKRWADLEEQIGIELQKVDTKLKEQFYFDKEELDSLLIDYLEKEQEKYINEDMEEEILEEITQELRRSLLQFSEGLSLSDINSIKNTLQVYRDEVYTYRFISFNYTNTLDFFVEIAKGKNNTLGTHLGNSTSKAIILGMFYIYMEQ